MKKIDRISNVLIIEDTVVTPNLNPNIKVYNEKLIEYEDIEYRVWDPRRSKLSASIKNGLNDINIDSKSKILYLGASSGTTASHISDIVVEGVVYCIEFSPKMLRKLISVSDERDNMLPLLEDANKPEQYISLIENVDLVYCDVAQPNQTELFIKNLKLYLKDGGQGIIMIKARSIDVTKNPNKIFKDEEVKLRAHGFSIIEKIRLEPYEKDHLAIIVENNF